MEVILESCGVDLSSNLIEEDLVELSSDAVKDALLLSSLAIMQIEDSSKAVVETQTPTPHYQLVMPPLPTVHVEVTKVAQENIFSTLTPLHTLPSLNIINNVQGGVKKEENEKEEDKA